MINILFKRENIANFPFLEKQKQKIIKTVTKRTIRKHNYRTYSKIKEEFTEPRI